MSNFLDMLLRPEIPNVAKELPTAEYEIQRLSALAGEPVTVVLRGLPYGKVQELRDMRQDSEIHVLLAGCPELKNPELSKKFGGATPVETVKAMLLPGEIADLSRAVEQLCGYRQSTIKAVKNDSRSAATRS